MMKFYLKETSEHLHYIVSRRTHTRSDAIGHIISVDKEYQSITVYHSVQYVAPLYSKVYQLCNMVLTVYHYAWLVLILLMHEKGTTRSTI